MHIFVAHDSLNGGARHSLVGWRQVSLNLVEWRQVSLNLVEWRQVSLSLVDGGRYCTWSLAIVVHTGWQSKRWYALSLSCSISELAGNTLLVLGGAGNTLLVLGGAGIACR